MSIQVQNSCVVCNNVLFTFGDNGLPNSLESSNAMVTTVGQPPQSAFCLVTRIFFFKTSLIIMYSKFVGQIWVGWADT